MPLVQYPVEITQDTLSGKMLEAQLFYGNALPSVHIIDILYKGVSVCEQRVGTDISLMWKVLGQEPAKLFGKVCRCRHKPCKVLGTQKHLSVSTAFPTRDTSQRSGEHIAPSLTVSDAPGKRTGVEVLYISLSRDDPSEPDCGLQTYA